MVENESIHLVVASSLSCIYAVFVWLRTPLVSSEVVYLSCTLLPPGTAMNSVGKAGFVSMSAMVLKLRSKKHPHVPGYHG